MPAYDDSYSRLVAWLKIVLPLAALAILSTLFLVSRSHELSRSIPIAKGQVEELARDQKIGSPAFSGVTDSGTAINIFAQSAQPDPNKPGLIQAVDLRADLKTPSGATFQARAAAATFDPEAGQAVLRAGVTVTTSTGYTIQTDELTADTQATRMATRGKITADGPLGRIEAGKMVLRQQSDAGSPASYELVFKEGVHLVYQPQN